MSRGCCWCCRRSGKKKPPPTRSSTSASVSVAADGPSADAVMISEQSEFLQPPWCRAHRGLIHRKPRMDQEVRSIDFWRGVISECLATFFFVFLACLTTLRWDPSYHTLLASPASGSGGRHHLGATGNTGSGLGAAVGGSGSGHHQEATARARAVATGSYEIYSSSEVEVIIISMAFGLSISVLTQCFGHISGGHFNPAITMAKMLCCKISPIRGLLYFFAQAGGAIAGAALLYGITPSQHRGNLAVLTLHPSLTTAQGLGLEILLTFVLVFTVFACSATHPLADGTPLPPGFLTQPFSIGLSVTLAHLVGVRLTGCGINPARALGPAFIQNRWHNHWVYWLGPMAGGVLAGLLYEYIFDPYRRSKTLKSVVDEEDSGRESRHSERVYGFSTGSIHRSTLDRRSCAHENTAYDYAAALRNSRHEYEMNETEREPEPDNYGYTRTKF